MTIDERLFDALVATKIGRKLMEQTEPALFGLQGREAVASLLALREAETRIIALMALRTSVDETRGVA